MPRAYVQRVRFAATALAVLNRTCNARSCDKRADVLSGMKEVF